MLLTRAIASVAAIFLGVSAAVAQQPETAANNAAATASRALTNPPVFEGLMVDAKGKTVGRLFYFSVIVREVNRIWVGVTANTTGFLQQDFSFLFQSADCTGQGTGFWFCEYISTVYNSTDAILSGDAGAIDRCVATFASQRLSALKSRHYSCRGNRPGEQPAAYSAL
jgi:hypothetical protein